MDELPLSKEKGECEDYGSILFWKWVGKSAFGKDVNIKVIDNKIVVKGDFDDSYKKLELISKRLDYISEKWKGIQRVWFIGIDEKDNGCLYNKNNTEIYIEFKDKKRIYPVLCLLKSSIFYMEYENISIDFGKKKIEIKRNIDNLNIVFKKVKSPLGNILLYLLHNIDVTANTSFHYLFYPFWKKSKWLHKEKSGIEMLLVSTNHNSNMYKSSNIRKYIFSNIDQDEILSKLHCNLIESENMHITYECAYDLIISKISISYDDYYPNKIVAKMLKKQLKRKNIKVNLVKSKFEKVEEKADFRLYLMPKVNGDIIFNFYLLAILLGLKKENEEYRRFLKLVLFYYEEENSRKRILSEIRDIFRDEALYYSIGEVNNTYLYRNGDKRVQYEEVVGRAIETK